MKFQPNVLYNALRSNILRKNIIIFGVGAKTVLVLLTKKVCCPARKQWAWEEIWRKILGAPFLWPFGF